MAKAIDKVAEFEKQFDEYKKYGFRILKVTGNVNEEFEDYLKEKYPTVAIFPSTEEGTIFHISNGKIITL